ncbi:MAG: HD domain-containing protein [Thiovulaceae bacterium]|nr:HD domain-containing protein [Sulfurimonadaceae bacterium]
MAEPKVTKYLLIEKAVITEGATISFDIYSRSHDAQSVEIFMEKEHLIDGDDKIRVAEVDALYIRKDDRELYDEYFGSHLRTIAQSHHLPFETKSVIVYNKAEKIMKQMFQDPDALGNAEVYEEVVDDLIFTILDNDFTVASLMRIAAHDYYTHTHSINVSIYSLSLGNYLGLKGEELKDLGSAALLHDLGKSKVDYEIINKNGKLTTNEYNEMKLHPSQGDVIARNLGIVNKRILSGIRSHHEKLDGSGYPDQLKDSAIGLFPRIIGICDIFDALTTKRSYKDPMTTFNTFKLIKNQMQGHLDEKLLNNFILMLRKEDEMRAINEEKA